MKTGLLLLALWLLVHADSSIHAQGYLSWGVIPGHQYDTSQLDSVDPITHRLIIHIPVYSLPQKGSLPPLSLSLVQNSPSYDAVWGTYGSYVILQISGSFPSLPGLVPTFANSFSTRAIPVAYTDDGAVFTYGVNYLVDYTGAEHEIHPLTSNSNHAVAIDGSGYGYDLQTSVAYDSSGNAYNFYGSITDTHGNTVVRHSVSGGSYYTDSYGRTVPDPSLSQGADGAVRSPGCVIEQLPSFQGTSPYTFCYETMTVQPHVPNASASRVGLFQPSENVVTLTSVATPAGLYGFTYDSFGDVTRITLPTGGSISYSYETKPNSADPTDYTNGYVQAVTKRILSTGSDPLSGQSSETDYSFDYQTDSQSGFATSTNSRTVNPDRSYSVRYASGQLAPSDDGSTAYYSPTGVFLKKVHDTLDAASPYNITSALPYDKTTTLWANGRVDQVCITYFGSSVDPCSNIPISYISIPTWYDENQYRGTSNPGQTPDNAYLFLRQPVRLDEFQTGWNSVTGALARRSDTHYAVESQSDYASRNLWSNPSSTTVSDSAGNIIASSSRLYDEPTYSPYGLQGNLTSVQSGGISTHTSWFSDGVIAKTLDANGNATTITDRQCNDALPKTVTNALSQQTVYTYDCSSGLVSSVLDPNNESTSYTYDGLNNVVSTTYPDGGSKGIDFHGYAQPLQVTVTISAAPDPDIVSTDTYDGLGRPTNHSVAGGASVNTTYDSSGRVYRVSQPFLGSTTGGYEEYHYDSFGRKIKQIHPDSTWLSWCYDGIQAQDEANCNPNSSTVAGVNQWVDSTDESSSHQQLYSDFAGALSQVIDAVGSQTVYGYDSLGNITRVSQSGTSSEQARIRQFNYDSLSRLMQSYNPESGWICYGTTPSNTSPNGRNCTGSYDYNGNLRYKTDARGVTTSYYYDNLNRLTSRAYSDGTPTECWTYDTVAGGVGSLAKQWTQPSSLSCSSGPGPNALTSRSVVQYDSVGRVLQEKQCVLAACTNDGTLGLGYDLAGNVISYSVPTARDLISVGVGYTSAGWPNLFTAGVGGNNSAATLLNISDFSPTGALGTATVGTHLSVTKTYDSQLRTTGEAVHVQ